MDRKKDLETSLVIVSGLLILFIIKKWQILLSAAILTGFTGIFLKRPASWITWFWDKIADILGKIVPKIILTIIFYMFLCPISLLSRVFRKAPHLGSWNKIESMWINRVYTFNKNDLKNPW
jgi:hypothetical protein